MYRTFAGLFLLTLLIFTLTMTKKPLRYIPIGDSYTIGEGVQESERWPNLLAVHLTQTGNPTRIVTNPAQTGWTTRAALDREIPLIESERPDLVTILIGVNDIVQGVSLETFEQNLSEIIDRTQEAIDKPGAIILITIPDFTLTPAGRLLGNQIALQEKLSKFNGIIKKQAIERKLPSADIHAVSIRLGEDPLYVADDGLHPSPAAYIEWEKEIFRAVSEVLNN